MKSIRMVNGTTTMNVNATRQLRRRIEVPASPIGVGTNPALARHCLWTKLIECIYLA